MNYIPEPDERDSWASQDQPMATPHSTAGGPSIQLPLLAPEHRGIDQLEQLQKEGRSTPDHDPRLEPTS